MWNVLFVGRLFFVCLFHSCFTRSFVRFASSFMWIIFIRIRSRGQCRRYAFSSIHRNVPTNRSTCNFSSRLFDLSVWIAHFFRYHDLYSNTIQCSRLDCFACDRNSSGRTFVIHLRWLCCRWHPKIWHICKSLTLNLFSFLRISKTAHSDRCVCARNLTCAAKPVRSALCRWEKFHKIPRMKRPNRAPTCNSDNTIRTNLSDCEPHKLSEKKKTNGKRFVIIRSAQRNKKYWINEVKVPLDSPCSIGPEAIATANVIWWNVDSANCSPVAPNCRSHFSSLQMENETKECILLE